MRTVVGTALSMTALVLAVGAEAQSAVPRSAEEYRLKAAIIYKLAKFVEWPATVFADATAPFTVCVIGVDPFGAALESTMQGNSIAGRAIVIRRLVAIEPGCHVLFVSDSEARRVPVILDQIRGRSVLSIGEDNEFVDQGGIVGLTKQGENMRFSISNAAAEQAHLKVSARVLALSIGNRSSRVTP